MANVTVSVAAQTGATLADKLTTAYALAPVSPDRLIVVIDAGIPKHAGEILPTPPSNCDLLDYRTVWDQVSNTRMGQATVDFGSIPGAEDTTAYVTVSAPWLKASSIIVCQVGPVETADHNGEDAVIEAIQARAINYNLTNLTFDIAAYAANGSSGQHVVVYQALISRSSS